MALVKCCQALKGKRGNTVTQFNGKQYGPQMKTVTIISNVLKNTSSKIRLYNVYKNNNTYTFTITIDSSKTNNYYRLQASLATTDKN